MQQRRCEDPWYSIVLDECRSGHLSDENCNFLHGRPTTVPGSWMAAWGNPHTMCGTQSCMQLVHEGARPDVILWKECSACKVERKRRARVAAQGDDSRLQGRMRSAVLIVPNNDIKSHANKKRAQAFAAETKAQLIWVPAKDKASNEVLKSEPHLATQKLQWLNRHDKECGDLFGMLPLCHNMPVCLTDHLDRSREKNLLRGTRGRVSGWVWHDDDEAAGSGNRQERVLTKQPIAVLVKFDGAKWRLPGLDEQGGTPFAL